jgi:hypothetical protein
MSAIAKPFVVSASSKTPTKMVAVEAIKNIDKFDVTDPNNSSNTIHYIVFTYLFGGTAPVTDHLAYDTEAHRDAALASMVAALATSLT